MSGAVKVVLVGFSVTNRGVPPLAIVKHFDVVEHGVGELNTGPPFLPVEQLDLHR